MTILAVFLLGVNFTFPDRPVEQMLGQLIRIVFPPTITPEDLHERYRDGKIKILLVPGHDNKNSGAEFRGLKEADLNLEVAKNLFELLTADKHFEVIAARDFVSGNYLRELASYFVSEERAIKAFREESQAVMDALITAEIAQDKSNQNHGFAKEDVALQLYGLNKWANENDIDIVIHFHFNDYPRPRRNLPGEYTGFAVYVPESQYPNALASIDFARTIFNQLQKHLPVSNLPFEKQGVIEDQELIAVGANASREGVSLLIEYGYIYEGRFVNAEVREAVLKELAFLTYEGIKKYFENENYEGELAPTTSLLPYRFGNVLRKEMRGSRDVLHLQAALKSQGLYPPPGKDLRECPLNGNFGPCVEAAVKIFQEKYQGEILEPFFLREGTGVVGPATLKKLNGLYGGE